MVVRQTAWDPGTPCWVAQLAADPERQAQFYGRLLGWTMSGAAPGTALLHGRTVAGLGSSQQAPGSEAALWITYLATADLDAALGRVEGLGGRIVTPAQVSAQVSHPGGDPAAAARFAVAVDPLGALFGLYEAGSEIGFQVAGEVGSVTWNELLSTDADRARAFYADLLGLTYTMLEPAAEGYATINGTEPGEPIGGTGRLLPVDGAPPPVSHWLTYFAVRDADTAVAVAVQTGGSCLRPAHDSPGGRSAVLSDPEGAVFAVIAVPGEGYQG